jgi:Terpene synthase family 2, C-terminal metal binding
MLMTKEWVCMNPYVGFPTVPPLYCPEPIRDDEALAREVDDLLLAWVKEVGIFAGQLDRVADSRFGRFAMLVHPDTDDPDRLLLSAQCIAALFGVDDHYCDDESGGSDPTLIGPRLSLALAAVEPAHVIGGYAPALKRALRDDPVLVGLRAYFDRVAHFATPSQLARVRHETIALFVTMTAEAAWRLRGVFPTVWEHLAQRQVNSFLPCMALIDIIGGYEVPANLYSTAAVRRATCLAASATVCANDLYSAPKESLTELGDFNLPGLLMAEQHCSPYEAMRLAAGIHDDIVRAYEQAETDVRHQHSSSPELTRYLAGLRAWVGGSNEWHRSSGRYRVSLSA